VHVESVAWISEQKNTLSLLFYLGAAHVYLRFDEERRAKDYAWASALFALGLLTKTVVATLPAALLVVFWWKRGRLDWRRDIVPVLPWFAAGAAAGLHTAWIERAQLGAEGADFALSPAQRVLLAGRVAWFYLGKLIWPADLTFIYPRWTIDTSSAMAYAWPAAALIAVVGLWAVRWRSRAPLAVALLFVGSLFPVLGFVNVYPFVFSFVADHFAYLPSLGLIAGLAAGAATVVARDPRLGRAAPAAAGVLLIALGCADLASEPHLSRRSDPLRGDPRPQPRLLPLPQQPRHSRRWRRRDGGGRPVSTAKRCASSPTPPEATQQPGSRPRPVREDGGIPPALRAGRPHRAELRQRARQLRRAGDRAVVEWGVN
jgi:hypothetical protein